LNDGTADAFENVNYCIAQMARVAAVIKLKRKNKTPARSRRLLAISAALEALDPGSTYVHVLSGISASCTHFA
jgi:hypothetical protein